MLNVQTDRIGDVPLLTVDGRLDGAGAGAFDAAAAPFRDAGEGAVAVDMGGVDYLSSAGLRCLMRLAKACGKRQARAMLIAPQPAVRQVLAMAGMTESFDMAPDRDGARRLLRERSESRARAASLTVDGRHYALHPVTGGAGLLERWAADAEGRLTCLALDELGVAVGRAGLGNTSAQAADAVGPFLSTGHMVSVRPPGAPEAPPDFIVTANPGEVPVYVADAWRLAGTPAVFMASGGGPAFVGTMVDGFGAMIEAATGRPAASMGWIIAACNADGTDGGWVGVGCRPPGGPWRMEAVRLEGLSLPTGTADPGTFLREALRDEAISGAFEPGPADPVGRCIAWLYVADAVRAAQRSTCIVFEDETDPPEEWEWIARRIYADAGRVSLRRLCGGFSAATFHAESRDREGRRMLPTVLKLADPAFSEREDRAYDLYVSRYILNNSAVRMGRCARNGWVGLRYNFLGITGPESRLQWIGGRFADRPVDETLPLFRELFGRILAPWYAQARPAAIAPYREHDPRRLFPGIIAGAREVLGIGPDAIRIPCPPLGRDLPNPYAVLNRVYPARADAEWPGMSSIVHGDLNLNNVLLDERSNLYVIDFSETHTGDLGGDFARIEPLLLLQMTRLRDEADLAALLRYLETVLRPDRLFDPPDVCPVDDPFLPKAHALVGLLRREVQRLAGGRQHAVPYLLGLLRWTLPIILFRQMPLLSKRASCFAAALMSEALMEADPDAARCLARGNPGGDAHAD